MAREIRGWNIGEVVTANEMTLNTANIYEETGSNGEANLPCIYNGLTLQSQAGTGNSIVTFNPGVARCQDLPVSTYTYLPSNAYGTGYPCYIDISALDSNTVITLATSPSPGYIVATFTINPTTSAAVNYVITGSLLQIATGSYNPAIHVRLCQYTYTGSTFVLDFTPGTHRDTDFTGIGGINWNYQNSSLEINTPASQTGTSVIVKQPLTSTGVTTLQSTTVIQSANALQFNNSGDTHHTSLQAGNVTSNVGFILPIADATSAGQFITSNMAGQLSFANGSNVANIAANDSNVIFTSSSNPYQICNPTAARTYTMPAILTAGIPWTFVNQSTTDVNIITLQTSGSNIIDFVVPTGTTVLIPLTSTPTTAANWQIVEADSSTVSYSPTFSAGFGTPMSSLVFYRRVRDNCIITGRMQGGVPTAAVCTFTLPGSFTFDSAKIPGSGANLNNVLGTWTSPGFGTPTIIYSSIAGILTTGLSTNLIQFVNRTGSTFSSPGYTSDNGNIIFNNNVYVDFDISIPITNWH